MKKSWIDVGLVFTGPQFALCVVIPMVVGHHLGRHFGVEPFGLAAGTVLGFAAGLWGVVRRLHRRTGERRGRPHAEAERDDR